MRTELMSKWLRAALMPALMISGSLVLSGCGGATEEAAKPAGAAVSPLASDRNAMEKSKEGMMKSMSKNK